MDFFFLLTARSVQNPPQWLKEGSRKTKVPHACETIRMQHQKV